MPPTIATFPDLTEAQDNGHACVVCRTSFLIPGSPPHAPVGTGPSGGQVFACAGTCAPLLGAEAAR